MAGSKRVSCVLIHHRVVILDGSDRIEQRRRQIGLHVEDPSGVIRKSVHDTLNVRCIDLAEPMLDKASGILLIPPDFGHGALVHRNFDHDLNKLIKLGPIVPARHNVVFDLFFYSLSESRTFVHSFIHRSMAGRKVGAGFSGCDRGNE